MDEKKKEKKVNYVFKRVEKKYLLNEFQYRLFIARIKEHMELDEFGLHTICNIYYDTDTYDLIRVSLEKPKYKEKFRVRSYGVPKAEDKVFLEIKKKYDGIVYKRRISSKLEAAMEYLENGTPLKKQSQISKEIDYFFDFYDLSPKVYLAYDREAYFGKEDSEIRLTVDRNIRSRDYDLDLSLGDHGEKLLPEGSYLIEIKVAGAYPMWLTKILSDLKIYSTSFSKYGNVYKNMLLKSKKEKTNEDVKRREQICSVV